MTNPLVETVHACGFIISEANGNRSRDNAVLVSGQKVKAGQVLGRITSGGKLAFYDNDASDGTQAAIGISINDCDATSADQPIAILARDAEVIGAELVWETAGSPAVDQAAGKVDLAALHIIVR